MEKKISTNYWKQFKPRKKRAVAEIIGSLMLVAITVVGATILTTFVGDSFEGGLGSISSETQSVVKVDLIGYDTRDSSTLMKYVNLDNQFNGQLCGNCTSTDPNEIPADGGSEFIVIQVQNKGLKSLFLRNIFLNDVPHVWDPNTSANNLDASATDVSGASYPRDGMFSVIPIATSPTQNIDNQIHSGQTVDLIVKLSTNDDILLNKSIRVLLNVGAMANVDFVIESGDAR